MKQHVITIEAYNQKLYYTGEGYGRKQHAKRFDDLVECVKLIPVLQAKFIGGTALFSYEAI